MSVTGTRSASLLVYRGDETLLYACDANSFFKRLRGLHGLMPLGPQDALIIRPCKAIHTWRMPAPIDVAFVNATGSILKCLTVPPGRWSGCVAAQSVIEMAEGTLALLSLETGTQLSSSGDLWS